MWFILILSVCVHVSASEYSGMQSMPMDVATTVAVQLVV